MIRTKKKKKRYCSEIYFVENLFLYFVNLIHNSTIYVKILKLYDVWLCEYLCKNFT